MISNYSKTKEDVLSTYSQFLSLVEKASRGKVTSYDSSLEALRVQAVNIRHNKFILMVVGEAKSGKSTFINAYLGEEILPMDVKQCTSAIVEIRFGEKFILRATDAGDRVRIIKDEDAINKFLLENAAMDDKYRDIPVSTINIELLMRKKDNHVAEEEIKDLIKGIAGENLYHLSPKDYETKIRSYVKEKQPAWREIVKRIEIEYPFADIDMKGIEIVDTPGVNAQGRVGDITDRYIENANAVMFLKPITGAALEATSFRNFLDSKGADRNRNAMFLILTRAANETPENVTRIHKEAIKQFPSISPKQIIYLDSKAGLFYSKAKGMTEEELANHIGESIESNRLDAFLEAPWYRSCRNRDVFLKKLRALSNFEVVDDALNQFAHKAQFLALSEFLGRMRGVLKTIQDKIEEEQGFYRQKAKDPVELAYQMGVIKDELEQLLKKINSGVDAIRDQYGRTDGEIDKKADAVIAEYKREVSEIDPSKTTSLDELEKITFRKIDIFKRFQHDLQKNIVAECDAVLIALIDKSPIKYSALKPDLTVEMIEKIKTEQKEKATEKRRREVGSTFSRRTEVYDVFSQPKYFKLFRTRIDEEIEDIKSVCISSLRDFVTDTTRAYRSELEKNARIKRDELTAIAQEKQTAEEIQETMRGLQEIFDAATPMIEYIQSVMGGIETNVGR